VVSIPFNALRVTEKDSKRYLVMDTTKDALMSAPSYQYDKTKGTVGARKGVMARHYTGRLDPFAHNGLGSLSLCSEARRVRACVSKARFSWADSLAAA
jgi:hypothetical protein